VSSGSSWLGDARSALRGPRRARRRLLLELEAHLEDAVAAEVDRGASLADAEAAAVERMGSAAAVAAGWNAEASSRRWAARGRVLLAAAAIAAVAAPVGLAQRGSPHRTPPTSCKAHMHTARCAS
jgi:HAAS domain-containing protein